MKQKTSIMKKFISTFILLAIFATFSLSQELTQTVRGTIVDMDSKTPLVGTVVAVAGTDPIVGTITDANGRFRIESIPVGRISLQLSYIGYEPKTIPNVVVNSGKEVILNLSMQETTVNLDEIAVKANKNKGEAVNEMALLSSRSISPEVTKRFAGGFDDPSRILSNFAGVTSTQDGSNDIIVRGNSPKYVQWRLEGVEITNPNHFEDQNSSSGGISAINNNLLATSDFYTGAFTAEYGDVLSGVYDVKLRAGNNEKFESTFGLGIIGTDFTVEGPFKKGYAGSFLLNYRYSTISVIKELGLVDIDGILKFQDLTFKVVLPTKRLGSFSIFGMGGLNSFLFNDIKRDMWSTPGNRGMSSEIVEDYDKGNYMLNTGINHTLPLNSNSYIKTTLAYSANGMGDDIFESSIIKTSDDQGGFLVDTVDRTLNYSSSIKYSALRGAMTYNNKLNAKNKIQIGTKYTIFDYDNNQSQLADDLNSRQTLLDFEGKVATLRNFVSWKYRPAKNLTLVAGLHNMNVLINNKSTLEPRVAIKWETTNSCAINLGYGNHSNMERIHNYFTKVELEDGSIVEPNKELDLLKAHHYVLGFEKRFSENMRAKLEFYYQDLYNLPVENVDTSYYSTINEGMDYRYVDLVNKGTGKNYGAELTIERFFNNNYYYMINASLYEAKYKSLEGIQRNSQYNGNYLVNILCGKEFTKLGRKQNKTLGINAKVFFGGGRKIIPLLRDAQGNLAVDAANNRYWDYKKAYDTKIEDAYFVNLSISYKINKPGATHEIFVNFDNLTNNKGKITEYYDEDKPNSIGHLTQFGFFPQLMYRVYF